MNKRTYGFLVMAALFGGVESPATDTGKPHIILFVSDDHGVGDSGAYGDDVVRTPHIDRLATEGLRFTHAFAESPLCSPSRSVLETGLSPFRNGAHKFGTPIRKTLRTMPDYMRKLGYYTAHIGKFHHSPAKKFTYDHVHRNEATAGRFIRNYQRDKPLFLIVCTHPPHTPWEQNQTYDPAGIQLPLTYIDTPQTREDRADYYTDVTLMDSILGDVLQGVEERGWQDSALFFYTSDQGANWPFAKWCLYDAGLRVPFVVRWPGRVEPGSVSDAMVTLADVLPTCVEAGGGAAPAKLDGRSIMKVLTGERQAHRDVVFGTHTGNDNGGPGIANRCPADTIRTRTHRYVVNLHPERTFTTHITGSQPGSSSRLAFWSTWVEEAKTNDVAAAVVDRYMHRPGEELYDLENDPYEQHNLAEDPGHAELLKDLRRQLTEWRRAQGDPFLK